MYDALKSVASIMTAQRMCMDVSGDNLANVNTTGFKRSRAGFQDLLYQSILQQGTTPYDDLGGGEVVPTTDERVYTEGKLDLTGNTFDLAIRGSGFFQIQLPSGETAYTRDGRFSMDGDGNLVNGDGNKLVPNVTFPPTARNIVIKSDGTILAQVNDAGPIEQIGSIEITRFVNPEGLVGIGQNLFVTSENSGDPISGTPGTSGLGDILQSALEQSNVDVATEMTQTLMTQRAFQTSAKLFQTLDEMLGIANRMLA